MDSKTSWTKRQPEEEDKKQESSVTEIKACHNGERLNKTEKLLLGLFSCQQGSHP